jgi:thioredoxin-related protein
VSSGNGIKRTSLFVLYAFVFSLSAVRSTPELTLDDLRKLEIICFVPSYLPKDFRLQRVDITCDELHEEFDDPKHQLPLYSIVYSNDPQRGGFNLQIASTHYGFADFTLAKQENTLKRSQPNLRKWPPRNL